MSIFPIPDRGLVRRIDNTGSHTITTLSGGVATIYALALDAAGKLYGTTEDSFLAFNPAPITWGYLLPIFLGQTSAPQTATIHNNGNGR